MFASHAWLGPWLTHLAEAPRLFATADGALFGFARRHDELRLLGDGLSDELGPIGGDPQAAARALAATARRLGGPALARDLPGNRPWPAWLGGTALVADPQLLVRAPDVPAWVASRAPRFRRVLRSTGRRLAEAGAVIRDEADIGVLARLHRLRFGDTSSVFSGANAAFLHDAVPALMAIGAARLRVLEVGGAPVAALLTLRHHGGDGFYQSGFDPAAARLRPGVALLLDAVRSAPGGSLSLLRGDEPYKRAWATERQSMVSVRIA